MTRVNIALIPLRSCFECKHGDPDTTDEGRSFVYCHILEGNELYHQYDEKLLPRHCGHFEYQFNKCEVCDTEMQTVTYMSSIYGMIPICSQECARKQAAKEDQVIDELYNTPLRT